MERFIGQPLPAAPHIAVMVWDKVGNFVVATVLLRGLRETYPGCTIDFFGGTRTEELEEASPLIDARFSLVGRAGGLVDLAAFVQRRVAAHGPYDLGINLDAEGLHEVAMGLLRPRYVVGRAYDAESRRTVPPAEGRLQALASDPRWNRLDLLDDFGDVLTTQYIGEIFCRLAGVETDFTRPELPIHDPGPDVPDVLIATGGSRPAKSWPRPAWLRLAELLRAEGLSIGLIGIARARQAEHYGPATLDDELVDRAGVIDCRGRWTLPQVAGACRAARAAITIDNAIGHIAAAVGTPTVMLWGGSPWRLWQPRAANARHLLPTEVCALCEIDRFRSLACLRERHVCMEAISPERVVGELRAALAAGRAPAEAPILAS